MLTPAGLSLITTVCTCRGRDSPRLRLFRARARFRAPLFPSRRADPRTVAAGTVSWSRPRSSEFPSLRDRELHGKAVVPAARAVCFSRRHAQPPATPACDQYNPKLSGPRVSKAGLPSRPTGKRPRRWRAKSRFQTSRNASSAASFYAVYLLHVAAAASCSLDSHSAIARARARHTTSAVFNAQCLSPPDTLLRAGASTITVPESAERIGRNYTNDSARALMSRRFAGNSYLAPLKIRESRNVTAGRESRKEIEWKRERSDGNTRLFGNSSSPRDIRETFRAVGASSRRACVFA